MGAKAVAWALDLPLSPSAKIVLVVLADHMGPEGECYPSHKTVCERASMSEATVKRQIRHLIGLGLVERIERLRSNGSSASNLYRLNVGALPRETAPVAPVDNSGGGGQIDTPQGVKMTGGGGHQRPPPKNNPNNWRSSLTQRSTTTRPPVDNLATLADVRRTCEALAKRFPRDRKAIAVTTWAARLQCYTAAQLRAAERYAITKFSCAPSLETFVALIDHPPPDGAVLHMRGDRAPMPEATRALLDTMQAERKARR